MSASQNKTTGKLGMLFMGIVCLLGIVFSLVVFDLNRSSVESQSQMHIVREAHLVDHFQRSAAERRERILNARSTSAEISSTVVVHDGVRRGEDAANDLAVREKVFEAGSAEFWQPSRAPEGGYDIERSIDRAAVAIAKRICDDAHERVQNGWDVDTITISADRSTDDFSANRRLVRRVAAQSQRMTHLFVSEEDESLASQVYLVSDQKRPGWGRVLGAASDDKRFGASVIVDEKMLPMPKIPSSWSRRWEISFHTDNQTSAEFARSDAIDGLNARIVTRLWSIARLENDVEREDKDEFMMLVKRHYPAELLVGTGRRALQPIRVIMEDERGNEDAVYYQTEVVWSGRQDQLRAYSDAIADTIRTRKRGPFVRLGLSLGLCILSLLTWLRVDWWLKGHYSLMSKLTFVILTAGSVTAVWNYPFHG